MSLKFLYRKKGKIFLLKKYVSLKRGTQNFKTSRQRTRTNSIKWKILFKNVELIGIWKLLELQTFLLFLSPFVSNYLFFIFFIFILYIYSSTKHQNQNINLWILKKKKKKKINICYKLRKYLVIGFFKTGFAVELIRPFMFANDSIVRDILPPKPVCLPHSNHLFYIYVLRLGQEEGYENSHDDDKSSKEKKETKLHGAKHSEEKLSNDKRK